jgi:hypothetical protein
LDPCSGEAVRLALKKMGRETSARQGQARALGWQEIKEFIGSAGQGLRADWERALLCVAYETLPLGVDPLRTIMGTAEKPRGEPSSQITCMFTIVLMLKQSGHSCRRGSDIHDFPA